MKSEESANKLLEYLNLLPDDYKFLNEYEIETLSGKATTQGLVNNEFISVAKTKLKDGTKIDWHSHDEKEYIILYSGDAIEIEMEYKGEIITKKLFYNQSMYIHANTRHWLKNTINDCCIIVILIPGSETFPKGLE